MTTADLTTAAPMRHRGGVLVIDDNHSICDDFRKIFRGDMRASNLHEARARLFADTPPDDAQEHVEVHCADQGQTGLAMVQSALQRGSPYAVAFVDMLMPPGWDGIETVDHLWHADPELEIVICTAFTDLLLDRLPSHSEHANKLFVLRKPFDDIEVWQLVRTLTRRGYLAQQAKQQFDAFMERIEQHAQQLREVSERLQSEMTRRQQVEATFAPQARDLARLRADLQQVADVAMQHLQESLYAVGRAIHLLAERYRGRLDPEAGGGLARAVEGVAWTQCLLQELLEYVRLEVRPQEFAPTPGEQALALALANLRSTIAESGAVVTHGPLPTVVADTTQLVQVFQHLLGNALTFCRVPPRVHVAVERQESEWVFAVRDNGIGLDPTYAERIFGLFQRLHPRSAYPGTGTGLAICKKIVERHNGRIWVESQPGNGATFFFTLPA